MSTEWIPFIALAILLSLIPIIGIVAVRGQNDKERKAEEFFL